MEKRPPMPTFKPPPLPENDDLRPHMRPSGHGSRSPSPNPLNKKPISYSIENPYSGPLLAVPNEIRKQVQDQLDELDALIETALEIPPVTTAPSEVKTVEDTPTNNKSDLSEAVLDKVEIPNPVTSQKNSNGVKKENKEKSVGTKPQSDLPQNGGCFISSAPLGPEVKKTEESQEKPEVTPPIKITTNGKASNERTFMETKIIEKVAKNKPSFMEKVSQRASALNLTRLSSNLVLATGSSTLRSVRLEELKISKVLHAMTFEEIEEKGHAPPMLEGVASETIVINENRDTEKDIEKYLHEGADMIHFTKGVTMVHAPEAGAFKKKSNLGDSRSGEGFAAALCAAYMIKYQDMKTQQALQSIKSRRPEAKPSTSLVLQLMDFEDNLAKNCKEPQKTSLLKSPLTADWKAKIKIALPLLIYSLIVLLLFKVIYEILSESSIFVDEDLDDELVCF